LHPAALELLAERRIMVLGSDGNNDAAPSAAEDVDFPVHVLAVNAMGLHLLDWLQGDALVAVCEELNRWSFLCVIAPPAAPRRDRLAGQPDRHFLNRQAGYPALEGAQHGRTLRRDRHRDRGGRWHAGPSPGPLG
jgi:hypothetical protein